MTLLSNGRPSIRITLPGFTAISSVMGVVVFVLGGWFGYTAFRADMTTNSLNIIELKTETKRTQESLINLDKKVGLLEQDIKRAAQDLADIKLHLIPKR